MIFKIFKSVWGNIIGAFKAYNASARGRLVDVTVWEVSELENIFGLLVLGSFVGLPSPPMQITLDLLPDMERELIVMLEKVDTASTALSEMFSNFDVG